MNPLDGIRITEDWLSQQSLQELFRILCSDDGQAMIAGGAVRNTLMKKPVSDVDLATTLLPSEVISRIESAGYKAIPTGIDHGTITVVIDGSAFEVTTLRQDIETDGRHAKVSFGLDWQADALRRDFTMNGLYCDQNGQVYDLVGGFEDLKSGSVRFIGKPETRIKEDALRILRFFRFFAWYGDGRPDAAGLKACTANRKLVSSLSPERVWMELKRLLSAPDPSRALLWMRTTGVLTDILPETEKWGIDAIPGLIRLEGQEEWEPDPMLRLMAMVRPDSENVAGLADRLLFANAERDRLVNWAESGVPEPDTDITIFGKMLYRSNPQGILDAVKLECVRVANTDNQSDLATMLKLLEVAQGWKRPVFPVKGQDLLDRGMKPGEHVGQVLAELEEKWVESSFQDSKQDLLSLKTD